MNEVQERSLVNLPGTVSRTGWTLPKSLSADEWLACGELLSRVKGALQWWLGDWWAYGVERRYGEGEEIAERAGVNYGTVNNCASVARAFEFSLRNEDLTFDHYRAAMSAPDDERAAWLAKAVEHDWSSKKLRNAIKQSNEERAIERRRSEPKKTSNLLVDGWGLEFPRRYTPKKPASRNTRNTAQDDAERAPGPAQDAARDNAARDDEAGRKTATALVAQYINATDAIAAVAAAIAANPRVLDHILALTNERAASPVDGGEQRGPLH